MLTVVIALGSLVLYFVAYHTYGRYLARRIFRIEPERLAPSEEFNDGVDYVPSRRELVFGHHFTSIAGTGPIVGPAVAVVWGWVPALIWVLVGSIFMGAVHDFGSLIISMRHKGRTIADLASDVVTPTTRVLFLLVVLVGLWIVLAVFGLVIATIFKLYPSSILPNILQVPIAVALGMWMRRGGSLLIGTVVAVVLMYGSIVLSANYEWAQITLSPVITNVISPVGFWTLVLLAYVFLASVLPVQTLLQPRDYINSHQLLIAMGLLVIGLVVAHPPMVAEAVRLRPEPARPGGFVPPFVPFLFVTIACGAISGFHCLVASGCSSRQLKTEADAPMVGYGAMLTEGFLAVLVILACCAGIGMGTFDPTLLTPIPASPALGHEYASVGGTLTGVVAWQHHYATWGGEAGLGSMLAPFVIGSANMIESIGVSHALAVAIMGVFVASFAATTLDSATRLQRYVIAELAGARPDNLCSASVCGSCGCSVRGLASGTRCPECNADLRRPERAPQSRLAGVVGNRYVATSIAVLTAGALALSDAPSVGLTRAGMGGLILWPVFGATNQLLGGLALLVITVWLVRRRIPAWATAIPMAFMLGMTGWAIVGLMQQFLLPLSSGEPVKWHLVVVSALMLVLELWIVIEGVRVLGSRSARTPTSAQGA
ncbi:MAG: carbon starvation protein A [Phycisphaerales bacterium]|nr:carbon starvation protein A [Phycisphaerales bacterium]